MLPLAILVISPNALQISMGAPSARQGAAWSPVSQQVETRRQILDLARFREAKRFPLGLKTL